MAALENIFSWSFSQMRDFETCRRKRYWAKHASWGGWDHRADQLSQTAYRLGKMTNRYALKGEAVEDACLWLIREHQAGRSATAEEAYEKVAKPLLERRWKESRGGRWKDSPKKYYCLYEHYYGSMEGQEEKKTVLELREDSIRCLTNFIDSVLPRLDGVLEEHEVPVQTISDGDPESFALNFLKVYAIPDYVYQSDGVLHIHDWKTGRRQDHHMDQVSVYGLWAAEKHHVPSSDIHVHIEYLKEGSVTEKRLSSADIDNTRQLIHESVAKMLNYLKDRDAATNIPMPRSQWELAPNAAPKRNPCKWCEFWELCEEEAGK